MRFSALLGKKSVANVKTYVDMNLNTFEKSSSADLLNILGNFRFLHGHVGICLLYFSKVTPMKILAFYNVFLMTLRGRVFKKKFKVELKANMVCNPSQCLEALSNKFVC